jgi:hypothetical protein
MGVILSVFERIKQLAIYGTRTFKVIWYAIYFGLVFSMISLVSQAKPTSTNDGKKLIGLLSGLGLFTILLLAGNKICKNEDNSKQNRNFLLFYIAYMSLSAYTMSIAIKVERGANESDDKNKLKKIKQMSIAQFVFSLLFLLITGFAVYNPFKPEEVANNDDLDWARMNMYSTFGGI